MLIIVIIAFNENLAQSSENDNISRNNGKTNHPNLHNYLLNTCYVPGTTSGALLTLCQ